jgi:hypothetical protein
MHHMGSVWAAATVNAAAARPSQSSPDRLDTGNRRVGSLERMGGRIVTETEPGTPGETPERLTPAEPPERLTPSDPPERLTPAEPPEREVPA